MKPILFLMMLAPPQQPAPRPVPQLPEPYATPWFRQSARVVPTAGRTPQVPAGFEVTVFADSLRNARHMALAANGDVFISEPSAGQITVLRDANGDGVAETRDVFASDLTRPFGLAFQGGWLYVGENDEVVRFAYAPGQRVASGPKQKMFDLPPSDSALDQATADILGVALRQTRGFNHATRSLVFTPDGRKLLVSIGSATNASPNTDERRAAINEYNVDGSGHRLYATGLRNAVGVAFNPESGVLWAAVNERDHLGDDAVPDFFTSVRDGGFYGWPYAYIGPHPEPILKGARPDLVAQAIVPDVLFEAHAAPLGAMFYTGTQFPAEYRDDAFVALHGSINRSKLSGYAVMRVPFENGRPSGPPVPFASGFIVTDNGADKQIWGRPVAVLQAADGSLLFSDDVGNRVYRVRWMGDGGRR
jgi:glucose/arabinose dehydrogenase